MASLDGKTMLVTGATSGIGKATALELARSGATVVLVGRNAARTDAAIQEIVTATGNANLHAMCADLSVQADVRALAVAFLERYNRLDVLVNNAGGGYARYTESSDGVELTWALNYLSAFLLTNLLQSALHASSASRVINVTSSSHRGKRVAFADPNLRGRYSANRAYGQSKLALIMFTYELARRWTGTATSAHAVDPGPVATNLFTSPNMAMGASLGCVLVCVSTASLPVRRKLAHARLCSSQQCQPFLAAAARNGLTGGLSLRLLLHTA